MCSFLRASASLVAFSLLNHLRRQRSRLRFRSLITSPPFSDLCCSAPAGGLRGLSKPVCGFCGFAHLFSPYGFLEGLSGNLAPVDVWDLFHLLLQFLGDRNCHVGHFHLTQEWLCVMYKCFRTVQDTRIVPARLYFCTPKVPGKRRMKVESGPKGAKRVREPAAGKVHGAARAHIGGSVALSRPETGS